MNRNRTTDPTDRGDRGASLVEYALLVALISAVCLVSLQLLGGNAEDSFEGAGSTLAGESTPGSPDDPGGDPGGNPGGGPGGNPGGDPGGDPGGNPGGDPGGNPGGDPGDEEDQAEKEMTAVAATGSSGTMYWWDSHNDQGEWVASATFANAWQRGSYLTIEVTRVWGDGTRTTETVNDFYVPAGGSSNLQHWGNGLVDDKKKKNDVSSVEFKVVKVRTSDLDWKSVTFPVGDGAAITASAPPVP